MGDEIYSWQDMEDRFKPHSDTFKQALIESKFPYDPDIAKAVIFTETLRNKNKDPYTSQNPESSAYGIMQVLKDTGDEVFRNKWLPETYRDQSSKLNQMVLGLKVLEKKISSGKKGNLLDKGARYKTKDVKANKGYRKELKRYFNLLKPKEEQLSQFQQPVIDTGFDYDSQYYG